MSTPADAVDWQAPWLAHLPDALKNLTLHGLPAQLDTLLVRSHMVHADTLPSRVVRTTGQGKPLRFVSQNCLPSDVAYETFIAQTGQVPTRDNLHDFFNAAIWLTFPKTKAVLNARQYAEIARVGVSSQRTKLRDALTLFDENGAVLVVSNPSIGQALQWFDWQNALVAPRAQWDDPTMPQANATACVYIFGHALLEQLVNPRKPLCAHTWIVTVDQDWFAKPATSRIFSLDGLLSHQLAEAQLVTRSFSPLPVLGVPHFWAQNAHEVFYDDSYVFRSGRRTQAT